MRRNPKNFQIELRRLILRTSSTEASRGSWGTSFSKTRRIDRGCGGVVAVATTGSEITKSVTFVSDNSLVRAGGSSEAYEDGVPYWIWLAGQRRGQRVDFRHQLVERSVEMIHAQVGSPSWNSLAVNRVYLVDPQNRRGLGDAYPL